MDEIVALAQAILTKAPLDEAQAKLYAAVHVVQNGVAYGARSMDATLIDLLDERVKNEPYKAQDVTATQAPGDELAGLRKQMADMQALIASMKPAAAVNTPAGDKGDGSSSSGSEKPYVHGGGN